MDKEFGCSLIEVNDEVHEFVVGGREESVIKKIRCMDRLGEMRGKKKKGLGVGVGVGATLV